MPVDTLKAILKQNGHSLTKPRKTVFNLLLGQKPQTMNELIKKAGKRVDRASIYRTVSLYENLGLVHKLNIGWKYKIELSDAFLGHHHHFYCTNCGQTYSLPASPMLETMIDTVAKKSDFSPHGHQLEIYGFCQKCS